MNLMKIQQWMPLEMKMKILLTATYRQENSLELVFGSLGSDQQMGIRRIRKARLIYTSRRIRIDDRLELRLSCIHQKQSCSFCRGVELDDLILKLFRNGSCCSKRSCHE
ncbi:hypothetical protein HanRHA438_Chr08g0349421 [Helianthus annuus]|nr:hypothetical protein HanRHA438_Chr08g0349421 [Helianthus annuus]